MKNWSWTVVFVAAVGLLTSGCGASSVATPTSPTAASGTTSSAALTMGSLSGGTWAADPLPGGLTLNPGTCGNFKWSATSMTLQINTTTVVGANGTFSANCGGGWSLAGTGSAQLNGAIVVWGATGGVTGASQACSFTATGTAAMEADGVRVNYNATVCDVTVTGSELLKKR